MGTQSYITPLQLSKCIPKCQTSQMTLYIYAAIALSQTTVDLRREGVSILEELGKLLSIRSVLERTMLIYLFHSFFKQEMTTKCSLLGYF